MTVVILVIVALVIVAGLGYFIVFRLMKRSQTAVPDAVDKHEAQTDRVVAVDDRGRSVMESEDVPAEGPRDATGFENVLEESLEELHPEREG